MGKTLAQISLKCILFLYTAEQMTVSEYWAILRSPEYDV